MEVIIQISLIVFIEVLFTIESNMESIKLDVIKLIVLLYKSKALAFDQTRSAILAIFFYIAVPVVENCYP